MGPVGFGVFRMDSRVGEGICSLDAWTANLLFLAVCSQTGTGKTHTMMGEHGVDFLEEDKEKQKRCFGIIPRAVQDLFVFAKMLQVSAGGWGDRVDGPAGGAGG